MALATSSDNMAKLLECVRADQVEGEAVSCGQDRPSAGKCQAVRGGSPQPGGSVDVEVRALASDGRGIGRLSGLAEYAPRGTTGLTVFVSGALPGQRVRARIVTMRKRLAEAECSSVLRSSPEERGPACPHAGAGGAGGGCGGCPWQSLRYDRQLFWKERILRDALERVGRVDAAACVLPPLASPQEWGYRNKMEFAFAPAGESADGTDCVAGAEASPCGGAGRGGLVLGLRERGSRRVVSVTQCRMQSERTMRLLAAMRCFAAAEGLSAWDSASARGLCRFFVVREPAALAEAGSTDTAARRPCLAELIVGPELAPGAAAVFGRRVAAALREAVPDLDGFVLSRRAARSDVAYGETTLYREGNTCLTERLGPVRVTLGHDAFFQVNTAAAALVYAEAARMADIGTARHVWDVYCGVGSLGLYLAVAGGLPADAELTGIETMPGGVRMARRNAAALGVRRCRFIRGDAADVLRRLPGVPDVMTVDPPRAGLDPSVIQSILRVGPTRLIYVSCNPATLARDAARLAEGFRLCRTRPADLFPQTPHVESVSLFMPR